MLSVGEGDRGGLDVAVYAATFYKQLMHSLFALHSRLCEGLEHGFFVCVIEQFGEGLHLLSVVTQIYFVLRYVTREALL